MQNFANFNSFVPPKSSPIPNNQFSNFNQNFSTNPPSNLSNLQLDTNLEAAQTIPKPKLKANLNNNERGYYSSLLSQADPINANSVQGKEAVAFFKRSGLPVDVLKKIWLLASSNNTSLEREEFYVALKLIALAQNNIEVSGDSIMRNITTPLPKFNAIIHEKKEEKIEDNSVNINPSNEMNMNPIQPSFNSETNIQHIGVNNTQQYNNPNMMGITGSIPSSNSRGLSDLDSKISLEKMHKYEVCFKNNDPQHLGYIAGNEAKEIFMKSGLPTQQLFQIWKLVDTKKEGNLSKGEFIVALHLIMLSRSGFILPQELPKPLLDIILAFQTPQETNIKTNLHRNSMDLMNVNEIVKDDKYSALENFEEIQTTNSNMNIKANVINEKTIEIPQMQRMASQKMESITTDPYQQNILDQTQNELNQELKSLRNNHSNLIQEKTHDLNNLNVMIENYQKLMKKIHDENQFLLDESKKIEEKKNFAIKTILSFQNNLDMLLNKNLEIKQKIITQSSNAIDQITETATNTLNQLNQTSKNSYSESSNLTLMQRKQMFQEERDRERVRYEENLAKPQQFPKNFDVDMTQIESNIGNNDNLIKNKENNVNSFGINNIIQDIPLKNDNQMNNLNNNHLNNQNVSNFNNDMQLNNSNNFNLQTENPQNNQNYNISHEMQKSLNNSNESPQKAQEINNKMALTIKNIDSDQKEFANFGGFDMNQQDFNNAGGWGEFDSSFKHPGGEEQKNQSENPGFGFTGFPSFKF